MPNLNLKRVAIQQLQALHRMGVTEISCPTYVSLSFDLQPWREQDDDGASTPPATTQSRTPQTSPPPETSPQNPPPQPSPNPTTQSPVAAKSPIANSGANTSDSKSPKTSTDKAKPSRTESATIISGNYTDEALPRQERESRLQILADEVAACRLCKELCSNRTQTVFGVGNPEARIVFLGEGPGANEDRTGEPFVGDAGKLLDKIFGACKISRSEVFILNTVKCRPPNNRNPLPDELLNCRPFLDRQLEILQPDYIICLGSVAAKELLQTKSSLGKLRKQFHQYRSSKVVVTYHPAYLLRNPKAKVNVWDDMKMLMKDMGVEL